MNRLTAFIAVTLPLLTVAGCGEQADSTKTITAWPATLPTDQGNFSVTIQPDPGDIQNNRHFSLEVTIGRTAKDGESAGEELKVVVDADMPAHRHGMNTKPETEKTGNDAYRVNGMLFHMSGDWMIFVDVTGKAGTERASFPVSIE